MGVCGCEEDESQMVMADSLWEMTSNIKEVMKKRQIEKQNQRHFKNQGLILKSFAWIRKVV